jgi:hypothetical protein
MHLKVAAHPLNNLCIAISRGGGKGGLSALGERRENEEQPPWGSFAFDGLYRSHSTPKFSGH